MATLSILGLYKHDDSIFANMEVPFGVEKEDVVDNILLECSELEILYPDFEYMKYAIGRWSARELYNWEKINDVLNAEYNPLWNKDGEIIEERSGKESAVNAVDRSTSQTGNNSVSESDKNVQNTQGDVKGSTVSQTTGTNKGTTEDTVAGYNASTYQNRNKQLSDSESVGKDVSGSESHNNSSSVSANDRTTKVEDNSTAEDKTRGVNSGEHSETVKRIERGNIGVTMSQDMLKAEVELRKAYNIYEIITESFKRRFCVLVY